MKKKLIQSLTLLLVAVGVGTFVSCKDTNEDLYNEYRAEATGQSLTLQQKLGQLETQLNTDIATLQATLSTIKSCDCTNVTHWTQSDIETLISNYLSGGSGGSGGSGSSENPVIVDILDDYIEDLLGGGSGAGGLTLNQIVEYINNLQGSDVDLSKINETLQTYGSSITTIQTTLNSHGSNITNLLSFQSTAQQQIANTIEELNALKEKVDAIKQCNCDFTTLWEAIHTLETGLATAEAKAQSAMELATSANTTANEAKLTAEEAKTAAAAATTIANAATELATSAAQTAANAKELAEAAGLTAQQAKEFAETAKTNAENALNVANNAISVATTAQTLANANKESIDQLKSDVATIQETLTQYGTQIGLNTENIQKNTNAIAEAVNKIQTNAENIQKNKEAIEALQTQITTVSEKAAEALQKAIDADAKATTNAAAIANLQPIVEANAAAITNLNTKTQELETTVTTLQSAVSELSTQVTTNTTAITNLTTTVTNLTTQVGTIESSVNEMKTTLTEQATKIANLETELANVKAECAANLVTAKTYAEEQAEAVRTALMTEINNLIAQLANYYTKNQVYTKEEVDDLLKQLKDNLNITINDNTARIEVLEGNVTLLDGKVVNLQSAVDDHGERITALETKLDGYETLVETVSGHTTSIEKLTTYLGALQGVVDGLSTTVGEHTSAIEAINAAIAAIKQCTCDPSQITAINTAIDGILERLATAETNIGNNTTAIGQNAEAIAANKELINSVKQELTDLINELINKQNEQIDQLKEDLVVALDEVGAANDKIDALQLAFDNLNYITPEEVDSKLNDLTSLLIDKVKADSLTSALADEELKKRMDIIGDSVKTAFADIITTQAMIAALDAATVKKDAYEADKTEILGRISANETAIGDLNDAVETISGQLTELEGRIDALEARMNVAEANIEQALNDIQSLKSAVSAVQEFLAKQVTGIIIQGTYNPAFGTLDLPFDVQSNILVAYFGKPMKDVEFPTSRTSNYVRPEEALTEKDMQMINGVEVFEHMANIPLMFEKNYAGKVYMTINPNTADLSGLELNIVNTQDEESPIKLEGAKKSTEMLKFGYTRADNGFYEADAVVAPIDVEKVERLSVNKAAIKDAFNEIAKNRLHASVERVATDVYQVVKGLKLNKSGLKCAYTENGKTHSVYSQYNLAATAVDPLDFASYKDLNYQTVPGYERVNNLLDRVSKKAKDKIHVFFKDINNSKLVEKIVNLNIKNIEVPDLTDDLLAKFVLHMDTTFVMGGLSYHLQMPIDETVSVKFDTLLTIPVELNGVTVSVPVDYDDSVSIDLSSVTVETPTVVVTGSATGKAYTNIDPVTGLPKYDEDGNIIPQTILVVPVEDADHKVVGNAEIDLGSIKVDADINASGSAGTITLDDQVVAHFGIHKTFTGTTDIDQDIEYRLKIEKEVPVSFNLDKWFYFGDNGTDTKSFNLKFNYDMRDAAKDLWGVAQNSLGNVNDMLADLRDIVSEVNNLLDKVNNYETTINNTIDNAIDRVRSYIDKINNRIVGLVNSTNSRFQPFMVAGDSKGLKRLSGSKNYPTELTSGISVYPTSQTMELLCPIARKHVAVTNVFKGDKSAQGGNADCLARLKAANTGKLNTVLDGNVRRIDLSGLKAGYVYEIAYSGLDFHGNIATRKYYVTVK